MRNERVIVMVQMWTEVMRGQKFTLTRSCRPRSEVILQATPRCLVNIRIDAKKHLCIEMQWNIVQDVLYISFFKSNNAILTNESSSNHNRFYLEKIYKLETHWRSHAMIRIERSREIFSAHFTNSKIQIGSKCLFKMRE